MKIIYLLLLFYFLFSGCVDKNLERLNAVAVDLLKIEQLKDHNSNKNSPILDIVNIGRSLDEVLANRTIPIDSISIEIIKGDFFNEGNQVTHSILFNTEKSKLGLRLRYDKGIDKFHIVGYSGSIE